MSDPASSATAPKGADVEVETSPEFLLGYPQRVVLGVVQDDDYPPSLDKLVEIAQMTLRTAQRHVIYQILKRCLSSTDGKWRQIFKALQVVDYCLHVGCDEFLPWASFNKSLFSDLQTDERQQYHDTLHGIRLIEKESNHILDLLSRQDELLPFEKRNPSSWMFRVTLSPNPFLDLAPLTSESFAKYSSLENAPSLTMPKDLGELNTNHTAPTTEFEINPTPIDPVNHSRDLSEILRSRHVDSVSSVSDRSESVATSREYKYSSPARYMPTRRIMSDLVSDSKLETVFSDDGTVSHTSYESSIATRQRRVKREHRWKRCWELSTGTYGRVWLEESINEEERGNLRAVREISKTNRGQQVNYDRELEAMAKFSHSKYVHCFVQSLGWYENTTKLFTAMEYLENGDLGKFLTRAFPETEVKLITTQLLEGLSYMHENGFVHGDLKPGNILVSEQGPCWWVKLSDFGISRKAEEISTNFRTIVGTRSYLAPEILGIFSPDDNDSDGKEDEDDDRSDKEETYTAAVDLWALGAIIYQLLTNQGAFSKPRRLFNYVLRKAPFPSRLLAEAGISKECANFLEQLMAPAPGNRPSASQATLHAWLLKVDE
ncbi:unnamed protein product [Clonostachys rosea]|uniref:mitogen-activated protein kinase kinase n=1 Tax=Bionectria ochroleuca TaxID=29856 RepID=A0ABY6UEB5_BIOOC|nr:unnamed protein product [Clonostachys rosea]